MNDVCVPLCSMLSTIAKTFVHFMKQQFLTNHRYYVGKTKASWGIRHQGNHSWDIAC
jgi:hypothetical protein